MGAESAVALGLDGDIELVDESQARQRHVHLPGFVEGDALLLLTGDFGLSFNLAGQRHFKIQVGAVANCPEDLPFGNPRQGRHVADAQGPGADDSSRTLQR